LAFEYLLYGGDREDARFGWELRRRLAMDVVPALRDAEADLASWKRSPLRPLITKAAAAVSTSAKESISQDVAVAASALLSLPEISTLGGQIAATLATLVGLSQSTDVQLGLAPSDADRMLRSLRLLLDAGTRGVAEASLGVANTLYLTLKLLEIVQLTADGRRDHTFLGIEEPEAHLHPQVQRNIFRNLFRTRRHVPAKDTILTGTAATVLLTTHSPYIASVAALRSLVVLRASPDGTKAVSTANIELERAEEDDLERYLNVTRAEILFARCVLLVEGDAEMFLIPKIASFLGHDLDSLGVTVCSVAGTNFGPHVKLLRKLDIPFAVVTDYDLADDDESLGEDRVVSLMELLVPREEYEGAGADDLLRDASSHGIFLGTSTFEIDLLRSGRARSMATALADLAVTKRAKARAQAWIAAQKVSAEDEARFLKDISTIGKGRFAQRLAARILRREGSPYAQGPRYIVDAITYLVSRCQE
jgi:putative ATP-dependent endonuclease of OLD family